MLFENKNYFCKAGLDEGAALVPQSCFTIVQIESKLLTLMPQPFGYKCGQQALCLFPFSGSHCLEQHAVEVCGDGTARRKFVGLWGGGGGARK